MDWATPRISWLEIHCLAPSYRSAHALLLRSHSPVTASLREKGASKGAATSFLTPTANRTTAFWPLGVCLDPYSPSIESSSHFYRDSPSAPLLNDSGARVAIIIGAENQDSDSVPTWKESAQYGFFTLPGDIAGSLTVGFLLAGLISAIAPDNLLANLPGGVYSSILLTTLIAIPFYICSTGSIPLTPRPNRKRPLLVQRWCCSLLVPQRISPPSRRCEGHWEIGKLSSMLSALSSFLDCSSVFSSVF